MGRKGGVADDQSVFARKSVGLRHKMVKFLAPKLYSSYQSYYEKVAETPRPMTLFMKNHFAGKALVGAEIGVSTGTNALSILKELSLQRLYLIDPYAPFLSFGELDSHATDRETARKNLSSCKQVTFIEKTSTEAAEELPILDFVYIDGNHDYEHVKEDAETYYPKVRAGGMIGGHDFMPLCFGLVDAVIEFFSAHPLDDKRIVMPDWWLTKKR